MKTTSFNTGWLCNGQAVTLPHDAQISEKRGKNVSNGGHGYFPGGVYTYEKTFTAPQEWEGKDIFVEFEGVYKNATVSINGKELCFHPYGYTGFFVELTGLNYSGENTLTVVADNSKLPQLPLVFRRGHLPPGVAARLRKRRPAPRVCEDLHREHRPCGH